MADSFEDGARHYLAGRVAQAERCLRRVLKRQPRHADALHLMGLIALRSGHPGAARQRIRQAIEAAPENPVYHGSLGAALRAGGDLAGAAAAYEAAVELNDAYALGWQNLGQVRHERGETAAAETAFRRALALNETSAAAHFGFANARVAAGDRAEAERHLRRAVELAPDYGEAWHNLGNVLADTGRIAAGAEALGRAIGLLPANPALHVNLGLKLADAGRAAAAARAYDDALTLDPAHLPALRGRAALAAARGDDSEARALYDRALAVDPDDPQTLSEVANWHEGAGRSDVARAVAERALAADPTQTEANLVLARLDRRSGDLAAARDRLIAIAETDATGHAAYELGHVLDRLGDYDAAFAAFTGANLAHAVDRNAARFDAAGYRAQVAAVRAFARDADVAAWPAEPPDDGHADPVFFVGFPRSGTTLMEQILDAHAGLVSVEEQPLLEAARRAVDRSAGAYPLALADLPADMPVRARRAYRDAAHACVGDIGTRRLVDKLPLNIVHLVLIRRLFPASKVLVALRDPRDAVLSCWMQSFEPNAAMANFYDLRQTAALYAEVMGGYLEQRGRLGLAHHAYRYEELVADPEATVRAVFAFLGLPWQADVMDYRSRRRDRLVTTPSYQDVGQAIYTHAAARWRHYADHLAPVVDTLRPFVEAFGYPAD